MYLVIEEIEGQPDTSAFSTGDYIWDYDEALEAAKMCAEEFSGSFVVFQAIAHATHIDEVVVEEFDD